MPRSGRRRCTTSRRRCRRASTRGPPRSRPRAPRRTTARTACSSTRTASGPGCTSRRCRNPRRRRTACTSTSGPPRTCRPRTGPRSSRPSAPGWSRSGRGCSGAWSRTATTCSASSCRTRRARSSASTESGPGRTRRSSPGSVGWMEERVLGKTERPVSVVGLGTWQLGADWGEVDDRDATAVLDAAVEAGVTFFDTADVYGDGRSERLIGSFRASRDDVELVVGTKMGRRVDQVPENYVLEDFRSWVDRSRRNLGLDRLDLVQLHCPPTAVYSHDAVYDALDTLVEEQAIAAYGVSVETSDEALTAISRRGTATVQIILNVFRRKPLEFVLPAAEAAGVGIIARVPLASGLLSGRYDESTTFASDDHRSYNRHGEAFDVGEMFGFVDYETGVRAAREFSRLVSELPVDLTPAQAALAWVVQQQGVTTVI